MVTHQNRILMILNSLGIETEAVDVAAPGMDDARDFMRANGKKSEKARHVLPPQIFNGDKYCGVRLLNNTCDYMYPQLEWQIS